MVTCSECAQGFVTIKALCLHLATAHNYNVSSKYRCAEQSCGGRVFSDLNAFRKHLKKVHMFPASRAPVNFHHASESAESVVLLGECLSDQECDMTDTISTADSITPEKFKEQLRSQTEVFVAKLYSKPTLPRNHIQTIMDDTSSFRSQVFVSILKEKVLKTMTASGVEKSAVDDIQEMFQCIENPFDPLRSEYRRLKVFKESGDYISPVSYELGKRMKNVKTKVGVRAQYVSAYAQFIPIRSVMKKILELPDVMTDILKFIKNVSSDDTEIINHFIGSPLWLEKRSAYSADDIVLPLLIYFDDFEPNNPLGPHANKLGGIYVTVACLPAECQSSIDNIFLSLLFESADRSAFGNQVTFHPLVLELKYLETNGIKINVKGKEKLVYFVTGLVIGDNLGVNDICGFSKGFSANCFCRFCKTHIRETERQTVADETLLRDMHNYQADVLTDNVTLTRIHEECVFNEIPSFHVTSNRAVDVMHDDEEDVAHYIMLSVLRDFILKDNRKQYFTLDELNFRLKMFDFGPKEDVNRPPEKNI